MINFGGAESVGTNPRRDPFKSSGANSFPFLAFLMCNASQLHWQNQKLHNIEGCIFLWIYGDLLCAGH